MVPLRARGATVFDGHAFRVEFGDLGRGVSDDSRELRVVFEVVSERTKEWVSLELGAPPRNVKVSYSNSPEGFLMILVHVPIKVYSVNALYQSRESLGCSRHDAVR